MRESGAAPRSGDIALFLLMCLCWGITWFPMKIASAHAPPFLLAAERFLVAGPIFLFMALGGIAIARADWPRLAMTSLLINTGCYSLMFWGSVRAPSGLSAIVNFTAIPVSLIILGWLLEGERLTLRRAAAVAAGIAGVAVLFSSRIGGGGGDAASAAGLAAVGFSAAFYCCGAILARPLLKAYPATAVAGWQGVIGGAGLLAMSLAFEPVTAENLRALVSWPVNAAMAGIIIAGSLIGTLIYLRLLVNWGSFRSGLYAFVSPAVAVAAGVLILDESFGLREAAGFCMMFTATALAVQRAPENRRQR